MRSMGLPAPLNKKVKIQREFVETITADCFEFYDDELNARALALAQRLMLKYGKCELGRNRLVFHSKFVVVKIPTVHDGIGDNDWEGSVEGGIARSRDYDIENVGYPNTRWLELDGFISVMMERVNVVEFTDDDTVPDWVSSVDSGQVGTSVISGRLVAYDYGQN